MSQSIDDTTEQPRAIFSVSELNLLIREALQVTFPSIWVSGEVCDLSCPQSGHLYFGLKDDRGQLRAVIWRSHARRLGFELQDGMQVICEGCVDVYPPRGTYQLIVRQIEPQGLGALQLALKQLRDRLAADGLFDAQHKRALPKFPRRIAVITSPTGAAVRDFLQVLSRRWRHAHITIIPTRVQGHGAAEEIIAALQQAHRLRQRPDVIVLTRGGGSLEDLWCFNEEAVVREVFAATIPVVSAIGHEIDVTLTDLVADLRALTPTEAGERVAPSRDELMQELTTLERSLLTAMSRRIETERSKLEQLSQRPVLCTPGTMVHDRARAVDDLGVRLRQAMKVRVEKFRQSTISLAAQLEALSPLAVLTRGYSLTEDAASGQLIRSVDQVRSEQRIRTRLADGELVAYVENSRRLNDSLIHSPSDTSRVSSGSNDDEQA